MTTTAEHITARSQSNHDTLEALLGFDLQAERRRRGATQQELAAVIGADKGSVSRWECGLRIPAPHHLLALRAWHAAFPPEHTLTHS